jgi:hypothetical protein
MEKGKIIPVHIIKTEITEGREIKVSLQDFLIMSILTISCVSLVWGILYRLNWDLGALLFPVPKYAAWVQVIFSIAWMTILFIILMILLFRKNQQKGKNIQQIG